VKAAAGTALSLTALRDIPLIQQGDSIADEIFRSLERTNTIARDGDVFAIAQKIVSKAEGRIVRLSDVTPSDRAKDFAERVNKDPRLVELILSESNEVIRYRPGVLIVSHHSGVIMANAGIDRSNVTDDDATESVLLLPEDCDASARQIRADIESRFDVRVGVVVTDSVGRAWRNGTCGIALGASGIDALEDLRGNNDLFGRPLQVSTVGTADQIAAAAQLLMGEGNEGLPVIHLQGLAGGKGQEQTASDLVRDPAQDLFR